METYNGKFILEDKKKPIFDFMLRAALMQNIRSVIYYRSNKYPLILANFRIYEIIVIGQVYSIIKQVHPKQQCKVRLCQGD